MSTAKTTGVTHNAYQGVPQQLTRVHFVGVAGSGMAGLAYVAHKCGIKVSGSDLRESSYVQALKREGVELHFEHSAANVADPDIELIVASTAIPSTNPELIAATERNLPVWPRARMLAWLGRNKRVLAVAGTHGKTTSSSMLATALTELGADPSFLIGGVLNAYDSSARYTPGEYMVVEADESDASFVELNPALAIITNVEADHMDHFESLDEIRGSFLAFLDKLAPEGIAFIGTDRTAQGADLTQLLEQSGRRYCTYGTSPHAHVRLDVARQEAVFANGEAVRLELACSPGVHNLLNATAVLATLDYLGFDRHKSAQAISTFKGVHRRFDRIGTAAGVLVVDDYGHHPTEIAATLAAAASLDFSSVHLLFQPHRFTRTQAFLAEFGAAFDAATTVTLMEIYTAGEAPLANIDATRVLRSIKKHNPSARVRLISERERLAVAMAELAEPGSVVITMGAGDVTNLAPQILEALAQKAERS